MRSMLATFETSQDPIGPCGPLEQSKSPPFRHSAMAAWSSALDFGAQPAHMAAPCLVQPIPVLGEPFEQLHMLAEHLLWPDLME